MKLFIYRSPVGIFWIRRTNYGFILGIDGASLGDYQSAVAAADDVYLHVTGCDEWDRLDGKIDAPTDIYEWEQHPD